MTAREERRDPDGEAARLDHEDADRLAIEHGETDFAGFAEPAGDDRPTTPTEEAALSERDLGEGDVPEDDRSRPRPS
ncbi:hypothetical protein [Microbacterium rhizophilus]|uniref:hypothetical protein n=1 Tax=Microbacterium rhizophilus TaxID=3138934 RepID=UPI0031E716E4